MQVLRWDYGLVDHVDSDVFLVVVAFRIVTFLYIPFLCCANGVD